MLIEFHCHKARPGNTKLIPATKRKSLQYIHEDVAEGKIACTITTPRVDGGDKVGTRGRANKYKDECKQGAEMYTELWQEHLDVCKGFCGEKPKIQAYRDDKTGVYGFQFIDGDFTVWKKSNYSSVQITDSTPSTRVE